MGEALIANLRRWVAPGCLFGLAWFAAPGLFAQQQPGPDGSEPK